MNLLTNFVLLEIYICRFFKVLRKNTNGNEEYTNPKVRLKLSYLFTGIPY